MATPKHMKWWTEARFGMFIHWGLFSIHSRGVWSMFLEHTPIDEYSRLADRFTPQHFDARGWVRAVEGTQTSRGVLLAHCPGKDVDI